MGWLDHLLATWGLPLVVLGAFAEGDSVALAAGALAHRGLLPDGFLPVALAAAVGAFLSDQTWFEVGRRAGGTARARRLRATGPARRLRAALDRRPLLPLILFRFLWGTRAAGPVVFGAEGVSRARFLAVDVGGSLVWGLLLTGLGYGLGAGIERAFGRLGLGRHLGLVALGVAAILLLAWALSRRRAALRGAPPRDESPSAGQGGGA